MRLSWLLFGLLVAMALLVGAAILTKPEAGKTWIEHPVHEETMLRGRPDDPRGGRVLLLGWVLGVLEIAFFAGCLALGARKRGRVGRLRGALAAGFLLHAGVFTALVLSYRDYLGDPSPALVLGFPAPTAWLLYGLWPAPAYFIVLYVAGFRRWYFTPEDERRFQEVLETRRREETPA